MIKSELSANLSPNDYISVQHDDFDLAHEYRNLANNSQCGAVVTFCGLVRDMNQGNQVVALELEHYPGMTEKSLMDIINLARQRWQLGDVRIIHRVGKLSLNEQIVFVGVSSQHRTDAFDACQFIMDFLKTKVPLWKKEQSTEGEYWVNARQTDQQQVKKWIS
ncbi:MAG: molybdopterin synthase catalytic subunit MoaE [Aliiglaciecola sp.]|uniref:molybdopterin synthase catalytic subunit MoaE n=1 Tax=Aliiglaciecola sp. M165 TaxID=2593649 RepID=UPI00117CD2FC|nr:molybdopterin synthase catalytic subunit MoaE [Aliiglaciecola sp. M165]TRY30198.1 molybdopterin synthase catalytic subunit MoaE [Aliiglaciecola sp. M165]